MDHKQKTLGERAVACGMLPDVEHPATQGCILAQASERWVAKWESSSTRATPALAVHRVTGGWRWLLWSVIPSRDDTPEEIALFRKGPVVPTYGEACVSALEGSPSENVEVTIGDGEGLASWDNSSLAEVFVRQDDPRKHEGFAMTTELTGSTERASVTITAEFIEGLWSTATPFTTTRSAHEHGEVGRFLLWELSDGSVWAAAEYKAVMVAPGDKLPNGG